MKKKAYKTFISNKMDQIHIITSIDNGGAENNVVDLICQMKNESFVKTANISVLYLKGNGYWKDKLESNNIKVVKIRNLIIALKYLISELNSNNKIIISHLSEAEIYGFLAFKMSTFFKGFLNNKESNFKNKFFIVKHNAEPFLTLKARLPIIYTNYLAELISRPCQKIICISNAVKEYWSNFIQIKKLKTIYYGLSQERIDYYKNYCFSNDNKKFNFLFVGRLVPQKNIFKLLEAFHFLIKENRECFFGREIILDILGDGYLKKEINKYINKHNLENHIILHGYKKDIRPYLNASDCLIHVAKYEGLGLILLEAMASSKAIITSNTSAMMEIVKDNVTGKLCNPNSSRDIAAKMKSLLINNKHLEYAENGYKRLIKQFHIDKQVRIFEKTINS